MVPPSLRSFDPVGPSDARDGVPAAPRWEWRTFSRKPLFDRVAGLVAGPPEPQREEMYILSARTLNSVKLRNRCVSVKHLDLVSPDGLELWRSTLDAGFPLPARALAQLHAAWEIHLPAPNAPCWSEAQFLEQVVQAQRELVPVAVTKRRTPLSVGGCAGEHVDVRVNGERWESLAFQDADETVVHSALESLGLSAAANTGYTAALARMQAGTLV